MRARARRFWLIVIAGAILVGAVGLTLTALSSQVQLFYTPADLVARGGAEPGEQARIGGLVQMGSVRTLEDGALRFVVEDAGGEIAVAYDGFIPDLFREGQGVVANGVFTDAYTFEANELLAKHDENYIPREIQETLQEQGVYRGEEPTS